jgi:polyisoprenyl-phosphate glycosyltransferase
MMSVVIPAYNEESDIDQTVTEMAAVFDKNQLNYEILFVSSPIQDRTDMDAPSSTDFSTMPVKLS